ncbi:hypothetical protein BS47DRAFT_340553 [Hydnum rufescens UP504]|uniref:Uncharacterized protein n=1 Tax=Hydnum rufescens UP504 TaxID=1448309 RepID=A0A9P6AK35_9AGAM|nr:hypothetical protein BS47DRAFT_340553 [Hydnum rufescens UP504]
MDGLFRITWRVGLFVGNPYSSVFTGLRTSSQERVSRTPSALQNWSMFLPWSSAQEEDQAISTQSLPSRISGTLGSEAQRATPAQNPPVPHPPRGPFLAMPSPHDFLTQPASSGYGQHPLPGQERNILVVKERAGKSRFASGHYCVSSGMFALSGRVTLGSFCLNQPPFTLSTGVIGGTADDLHSHICKTGEAFALTRPPQWRQTVWPTSKWAGTYWPLNHWN